MRRQPIPDSTSIASAGYNPVSREMEIEFRDSGDLYRYFDVPAEEYAAFLDAPSRGIWFNRFFKPKRYRYRLIQRGKN